MSYDPALLDRYQRALGYSIGGMPADPTLLRDIRGSYLALWQKLADKLNHPSLYGIANALVDNDTYIYPSKLNVVTSRPAFLANDAYYAAWRSIADEFRPLTLMVVNKNIGAAQVESARLSVIIDALDTAHRVTAAVSTFGLSELLPVVQAKWNEMLGQLKIYYATREAAQKEIDNPNTGAERAKRLRAILAAQDASVGGTIAAQTRNIPGMARMIEQQGMGNIVAVFGGLTAAAQIAILVAITAAVVAAIYELNSIGVFAAVGAVGDAVKLLSKKIAGVPVLGLAILAGVGFYFYRRVRR